MDNNNSTVHLTQEIIKSLWKIQKIIFDTLDYNTVVQKIVNSILTELGYLKLGYRIIVLTLLDEKKENLERISISQTEEARTALRESQIPFHKIRIPVTATENASIKALMGKKAIITHSLSDILCPPLNPDHVVAVQRRLGIKTSIIYPIIFRETPIGVLIFSLIKDEDEISNEEKDLTKGFTDIVGLAIQNSRLYSRLKQANQRLRYTKDLLKKTNQKLEELDKQKDEFISVAAHELRAPMTAIKGFLSMILEGDTGQISPQTKEYLMNVAEGNERLIRLVNNMLNVSRIEEGRMLYQMGNVNLKKVVEAVFDEFKIEAENKNLEYKIEIPPEIKDLVYVDTDRIHEVISNLISNAVKYTDKGFIKIKLSNVNGKIKTEIINTGPIIPKEEQEKLFKKFSRTSSSTGKAIGTGLGLYISKLLVEKFGGKIGVISEESENTNFWFELPLVKRAD